jgi:peptidoglycan/LPS O-acetylase OafA/YrhL
MLYKIGKCVPAILWSALMLYLSFLPGDKLPKDPLLEKIYFDKIVHFIMYFALFNFIHTSKQVSKKINILLCLGQGFFIEIIQHFFISGRSFDVLDIVANLFGCLLAFYFAKDKEIGITSVEKKPELHFKHLDAVRAIGCLFISFAHTLIFLSSKKLHQIPIDDKGFIIQFGHMFISTFFVLSGFLISYFLIKEKQKTNTINIKKFYIRRAFRILPVYFVGLFLVAGTYKLVCFLFIKNNIQNPFVTDVCVNWGERFLLYITMLPNVAFCFDRVYFHLSNYWSIGVEEQFYLIWPLILLFSKNIFNSLRNIFIIYTILLVITFIFSYGVAETETAYRVFKLVYITRFAAFAFGGFCAYAIIHISTFEQTKLYHVIISKYTQFFCLILLIVFSYLKQDFIYAFKHVIIIIPANAIIIFNMALNRNNLYNIENKFLNYIGTTTYSMYAYNLIFLEMFIGMTKDIFHTTNIFILTIVPLALLILVSIASYKYIELNFLKIRKKYFD